MSATYTSIRLTRISLALKRSRSSAVMPAHNMPPSTPAKSTASTIQRPVSLSASSATPAAHTAPMTNCPSAPMFQTLERKHTDKPKAITTYTIKLDDAQMEKLRAAVAGKNWEEVEVPYARFAFKGPKVNVTAYTSGKVVVAGKETEDFVQNVIEAEVTGAPERMAAGTSPCSWFA